LACIFFLSESIRMQPAELVAIMAAIIYSGRRDTETERAETRQSAVEEAWQLWHLTMDEWSDPGVRRLDESPIAP
jgi:hypothetical protein